MTLQGTPTADLAGALPQSEYFHLTWDAAYSALVVTLRGDLRATLNLQALQALLVLFGSLDRQNGVRHLIMRSASPDVFGAALDVDEIDQLLGSPALDPIREYARVYASVIHWVASAPERCIHTVALVRGNALGALGLVLPFSSLVVEEGARMSKMPLAYCPLSNACAQSYVAHHLDIANPPAVLSHDAIFDAEALVSNRVRVRVTPCGTGDAAVLSLLADLQPRLTGYLSALRARLLLSHRVSLDGLLIEASDWASRALGFPAELTASLGHPDGRPDWVDCQAISDEPAVDEAIRALLEDQTGDNATAMVQEVLHQAQHRGVLQRPLWYRDSTPGLHVGDSSFESWYAEHYAGAGKGEKQRARDAYAAGMGDPLVMDAALAADKHVLTPAARDVLNERQRQQAVGYTEDHDDMLGADKLAAAAACHGLGSPAVHITCSESLQLEPVWPQGWEFDSSDDRRAQLVKLVALGLAALEAHDRAQFTGAGLMAGDQGLAA